MKKKILQIGPYSSTGGVSTHIKRLENLLSDLYELVIIDESPRNDNRDIKYFNIRNKNIIKYLKIINSANIVHIHSGIWWLRGIHILIAFLFKKEIIVTIHSLTNLKDKTSIKFTRQFLKLSTKVIVVNEEIKKTLNIKAETIPAFIPPNLIKEPLLPNMIKKIIKQNNNKKIIISNAFDLIIHNGQDLYGLDLLLNTAKQIKTNKKNYIIIFVLASVRKNHHLYDSYKKIITENGLEKTIYIINQSISFARLIIFSDLVVRATNTDGDALTIREAIYYKKPVIASNITERPEGTILFKNRDSVDLYKKIDDLFDSKINTPININVNNFNYYKTLFESIFIKL